MQLQMLEAQEGGAEVGGIPAPQQMMEELQQLVELMGGGEQPGEQNQQQGTGGEDATGEGGPPSWLEQLD